MTKQATNPDELMLIGAIRQHANANYNKGWDYIVECWTDGDILDLLSSNKMDLKETLSIMQSIVDLYLQKQDEQRADVADWGLIPNF